jgi:hypothetical protein
MREYKTGMTPSSEERVASMWRMEMCLVHTETFMNIEANANKARARSLFTNLESRQNAAFPVDSVLPSSGMLI